MRSLWLCVLVAVGGSATPLWAQAPQAGDVPLLVEMLSHAAPGYRTRAASALEALGPAAVPALVNEVRMAGPGRALRSAVILMRMEASGSEAAADLAALIKGPAEDWRWNAAVQVLARVSPDTLKQSVPELTRGLFGGPLRAHASLAALKQLGADAASAAPALETLLHTDGPPLRSVVLDDAVINNRSLAWTASAHAYDGLLIVETLIAVGAPAEAVSPPLMHMLRSDLPSLRLEAATWLVRKGTADTRQFAVPALASLLMDGRAGIREGAIRSLGEAGAAAAPAALDLAWILSRPEATLRSEAAKALGQIGPPAAPALPALRKAAAMQRLVDAASARELEEAISRIEGVPPPVQ